MNEEIYIPVDLDDAIKHLNNIIDEDGINYIKNTQSDQTYGHFGIGRWVRNNWGLWTKDSKLYEWFNNLGLEHPDDMSGIILDAFRAKLKNENFDLEANVKHYIAYWENLENEDANKDTVVSVHYEGVQENE